MKNKHLIPITRAVTTPDGSGFVLGYNNDLDDIRYIVTVCNIGEKIYNQKDVIKIGHRGVDKC